MSKIEWTDRTWNPVTGCSAVSEGCRNCYAAAMTRRLERMESQKSKYSGLINSDGHFNGDIKTHENELNRPLTWKTPSMVFVNSMSDLFHPRVSLAFVCKVYETMIEAKQHTYQVLTKRPDRMWGFLAQFYESAFAWNNGLDASNPLPNTWHGTSIENSSVLPRVDDLLQTPSALRFLSVEPLIGEVHLADKLGGIDWVIVGGESGPNARPCDLTWVHSVVHACLEVGVPVFVKQLGSRPVHLGEPIKLKSRHGSDMSEWPEYLQRREMPIAV